jgi:hypothetical protein
MTASVMSLASYKVELTISRLTYNFVEFTIDTLSSPLSANFYEKIGGLKELPIEIKGRGRVVATVEVLE